MQYSKPKIGFVGQGYVGKNYADYFESVGYQLVRYSLEEKYRTNKANIETCDVVFIAVPTPTTPEGFDASNIHEALTLVGKRKVAVIKSTIIPGTTEKLQEQYPDITILYSPEFLSESTAFEDVIHPTSSIVGLGLETPEHRRNAEQVLTLMPTAPFSLICTSTEAEIIKYTHNVNGYLQVVFFNVMHDLATKFGCNWEVIAESVKADPFMNDRYAQNGRGAGGNCIVKDFAAFQKLYAETLPDSDLAHQLLDAVAKKNIELLRGSGKSLHILKQVYGEDIVNEAT
jgi:nucleotide sugar dehydrogenase